MTLTPLRCVLQAINYAVFMAIVWYFATSPSIRILDDGEAVLTIAFAHAGQLREPCRRLTQEELDELPPNMRRLEDCPRERSPVTVEAELDGEIVYRETLTAPGLYEDGGVDVYFSRKIPAGTHQLVLHMNDSVRIDGFNHKLETSVTVDEARVLLVGFENPEGFQLHGNSH